MSITPTLITTIDRCLLKNPCEMCGRSGKTCWNSVNILVSTGLSEQSFFLFVCVVFIQCGKSHNLLRALAQVGWLTRQQGLGGISVARRLLRSLFYRLRCLGVYLRFPSYSQTPCIQDKRYSKKKALYSETRIAHRYEVISLEIHYSW